MRTTALGDGYYCIPILQMRMVPAVGHKNIKSGARFLSPVKKSLKCALSQQGLIGKLDSGCQGHQ